MFGNRLGWGISAALVGLVGFLMWLVASANTRTALSEGLIARTGNVALNLGSHPEWLDPIQLSVNAQSVLPTMTESKDAGPMYREAAETYLADKAPYEYLFNGKNKPRTTDINALPAIKSLVEARNCSSMNLFGSKLDDIIVYRNRPPIVEALYQLGTTAGKLSLYIKDDQPQDALALGEAVFSLGYKMASERLRWAEFESGVELMRTGALLISRMDKSRSEAASVDEAMRKLLKERANPLWTAIGAIDPDIMDRTAGDVLYIAKNSREKLWKIEALLKLGDYKFTGGKGPDQRYAKIYTKRVAEDSSQDPAVRMAAKIAADLTLEQHSMHGN